MVSERYGNVQCTTVASSCALPRGQRRPSGSSASAARTRWMSSAGPQTENSQHPFPGGEFEGVDEARRTVAQQRHGRESVERHRPDEGMFSRLRMRAGNPETAWAVTQPRQRVAVLGQGCGMLG